MLFYRYCFVFLWIWGQFPSTSPRGLYSEGRFNGGFFVLRVCGGGGGWGLFSEFYGFTSNGIRIIHIDICCSLQFKFRSHLAKNEKVMTKSQRPCINDGVTSSQDYLTTSVMFLHHCKQAFAVLSVAQERQQIKDSSRYLRSVLSAI